MQDLIQILVAENREFYLPKTGRPTLHPYCVFRTAEQTPDDIGRATLAPRNTSGAPFVYER